MITYQARTTPVSSDEVLGPCDVHSDCLECPLPACKYDDEQGYIAWYRANRVPPSSTTGMYFYDRHAIEAIAAREGINTLYLYTLIREGKVDLRTRKQLSQDPRTQGLHSKVIGKMIKRGDIERRHPDSFPPINLPGYQGYQPNQILQNAA